MLRFAVCDDIPADLDTARALLEEYRLARPDYDIAVSAYASPYQLLAEMERGAWHDVYLLDILMPGLSGIQLGRFLRGRNDKCSLIFGTVTPEYAVESYSVSAQDYLLKPFRRDALFAAMDRAVRRLGERSTQGLAIRTARGIHFLPAHEILYIESSQRALVCHMTDERRFTSLKLRQKFEEALAPLLALPRFCHPHKSFAVNMEHIRFYGGNHFALLHGAQIPIAPNRRKQTLEQYLEYLAHQQRSEPAPPRC